MMTQLQSAGAQHPDQFPSTIILQPQSLEGHEGASFYQSLDTSIAARRTVIVDLIWITHLEHGSLTPLVAAFVAAQNQGKPLTLLSMDQATRMDFDRAIQTMCLCDRPASYGVFAPEFEAFLDRHHQTKSSAALR